MRVALRSEDGVLDILRLAARVGAREEAVWAALRLLEANGSIRLSASEGQIVAEREVDQGQLAGSAASPEQASALETVRKELVSALRETHAYRRAYMTLSVDELFADLSKEADAWR